MRADFEVKSAESFMDMSYPETGDSRFPCSACLTGKTLYIGVFPNFLWFSYHLWYDLSIIAHGDASGVGISAKTLVALDLETL